MPIGWTHTYAPGDYVYAREVSRMFHTAFLERQKSISIFGQSEEEESGVDPVDDDNAYIAVTGGEFGSWGYGVPLGTLKLIHDAWHPFEGYLSEPGASSSGRFFVQFADNTFTVNAGDDAVYSDFDSELTRDKLVDRIGTLQRTTPRWISSPTAIEDQMGNDAEPGDRALCTVSTPFYPTTRTRVFECVMAGNWTPAVPQQTARPDILSVTGGTINPFYEEYMLDGSGEPLIDPETGEPYVPYWRDNFVSGDYMGLHLWQQTADAYKQFNLQTNMVLNGGWNEPATSGWMYWRRDGDATLQGHSNQGHGSTNNLGGDTYGDAISSAEGQWDTEASLAAFGEPPYAFADSFTGTDVFDPSYLGWNVDIYGARAEVAWDAYRQHREATLKVWAYARRPLPSFSGYTYSETFHANGDGLTENQWNLVSNQVGPEDRNPANTLITFGTGDVYGKARTGDRPVVPAEPAPDTGVRQGYIIEVGSTLTGGGVVWTIDWRTGYDFP